MRARRSIILINLVLFGLSYAYGYYKDAPAHKMEIAPLVMLIAFIFSVLNGAIGSALTLISWRYKPVGDYGTSMLEVCLCLIAIWAGWAMIAHWLNTQ